MSIELLKPCYVAGVLEAATTQHTLSTADEAYFVHTGLATYVAAPVKAGATTRLVAALNGSGQVDGFKAQDGADYLAWDDLRFPVQGINPAGTAAPPTVDDTTVPGTLLFSSSAENIIAGVAQMPHAWARATAIRPHVHWAKSTSASGGVVWELAYALVNNGGTLGAYSDWAAATDVISDANTAGKVVIASFAEIAMTDLKESCLVLWKLRRNPAATADTYAAAARLFEFDIHYQVGKFGTVSEIPT